MKNQSKQDKSYDANFEKLLLHNIEKSSIPNPHDDAIDLTISTLQQYLPTPTNKLNIAKNLSLLLTVYKNISVVSPFYWLASSVIYLLGLILTMYSANPTVTLMFFAPIPFIMMFFEDIKGREYEILEMELACKYSPQVILLARFIMIAFSNVMAMTIIAVLLNYHVSDGIFFTIIIAWLTPLTIVGNITLLLIKKIRNSYTLSVVLLLWMSFMAWLSNTPEIVKALHQLNMTFYSVIIIIGILLLTIQIKKYIEKTSERSILFES